MKIKRKASPVAQEPMGDASMSQQPMQDEPMPDMSQTEQPPMDNQMGNEDMGMGMDNPEGGLGDGMMGDEGGTSKEREQIQKNIGKACNDYRNYQGQDKEDLGKWISGMLDSLDGEDDEDVDFSNNPDTIENQPTDGQQMSMESVLFTKGQLESINEVFGIESDRKKEEPKNDKNNKVRNTPFNNPDYGKRN